MSLQYCRLNNKQFLGALSRTVRLNHLISMFLLDFSYIFGKVLCARQKNRYVINRLVEMVNLANRVFWVKGAVSDESCEMVYKLCDRQF